MVVQVYTKGLNAEMLYNIMYNKTTTTLHSQAILVNIVT
jgi:hypothetical protein